MLPITSIAISAALTLIAQLVPLETSRSVSDMRIIVVDSFGAPLDGWTAAVRRGPVHVGEYRSGSSIKLEYGSYEVTVSRPGFSTRKKSVVLASPASLVGIALLPNGIEGPLTAGYVKASVVPAGLACELVTLSPLFDFAATLSVKPTSDGAFGLEDVPIGSYQVICLGPDGISGYAIIEILHRRIQDLRIGFSVPPHQ